MHLKNAAEYGRAAVSLSPNSVECTHFYASPLSKLVDDSEKCNQVVMECERALPVQYPRDPAKYYLDMEKEMYFHTSTPEETIKVKVDQNLHSDDDKKFFKNLLDLARIWLMDDLSKQGHLVALVEIQRTIPGRLRNGSFLMILTHSSP